MDGSRGNRPRQPSSADVDPPNIFAMIAVGLAVLSESRVLFLALEVTSSYVSVVVLECEFSFLCC